VLKVSSYFYTSVGAWVTFMWLIIKNILGEIYMQSYVFYFLFMYV